MSDEIPNSTGAEGPTPGVPEAPRPDTWLDPVSPAVTPVAGPALTPLAEGTAEGWYRTTSADMLRYWDGTAWTDRTAPAEQQRATYRQRVQQRRGIVLLVVVGLNLLTGLLHLMEPSTFPGLLGGADTVVVVGLSLLGGLLLGGLLWTYLVALFPGRLRIDPKTGGPRRSQLLPWSILATLVATPILTYCYVHTPSVSIPTLTSASDSCHAYLQTFETLGRENASLATTEAAFSALHDAAEPVDPALAGDLEPLITNPTTDTMSTATRSVLTRCIQDGDLTVAEVQDWSTRLKALAPTAGP